MLPRYGFSASPLKGGGRVPIFGAPIHHDPAGQGQGQDGVGVSEVSLRREMTAGSREKARSGR